jgi:putative OPT family oligopeptide transporter
VQSKLPTVDDARTELTWRALVLGVLITLIFTAANAYFGLKAGLTFATSIPAAVISMALLRGFADVSVQENNIVQTVASAAGTLSSVIFVLPGLVMVGWWTGFPYWVSFTICALGGVLGVMYSIPLRRALVTNSDLPYPEGVACAEVLKVGDRAASQNGLRAIVVGSVVSALFVIVIAMQLFASDVVQYFRFGNRAGALGDGGAVSGGATGYDFNLSFALLAVGHLIGLAVGLAFLVGAAIAWVGAVPYLTALHPEAGAAADVARAVWTHKVRFMGAGTIGVASIWTLLKLVGPVVAGLRSALAASRARKAGQGGALPRIERDIPIGLVGIVTLVCLVPIAALLAQFSAASGLGSQTAPLVAGGIVYIALMSFFVAAVCGYMAGLIGSSNSPLSGVGILVVIGAALLLVFAVKPLLPASAGPALVAYALFVTSVVFCAATIANNNLQDLKTGQLVDATPWRQQVALIVGVVAGAAIIPPVLDLLNHAYGFAGAPGVNPDHALAAPQAALISALAQGVIQANLDWSLIGTGIAIGAVIIVIDEILRRTTRAHLPPLAVGLGIYLPSAVTLMVVVGSIVGWLFDRRAARTANPGATRQLGVLLASGLMVGESLVGVLLAALVVFSGKAAPLAVVGESFATPAKWLGGLCFAAAVLILYRWLNRLSGPATARH